jgi:hypothetical protein
MDSNNSLKEEVLVKENKELINQIKDQQIAAYSSVEEAYNNKDIWKYLKTNQKKFRPLLGIPQGYAMGPLLATMALTRFGKSVEKAIMYLDDGLVFSNKEIDILDVERNLALEIGCVFNRKKTRFIKRDGLFGPFPIEFLGIKFDPKTNEWSKINPDGSYTSTDHK